MTQGEFTLIRLALESQHDASLAPIVMRSDSMPVFLLDEVLNHTNLNDDNFRIAKTLIPLVGRTLIGVECCAGDKIKLEDLMCPSDDGRCFGGRPRFALAMLKDQQVEIISVDSRELCQEIAKDCQQNNSTEAQHPKQESRSAYMAQMLIRNLLCCCDVRTVIMNSGSRCNKDIKEIVRGAKPQRIGADRASFVRIRSALFSFT